MFFFLILRRAFLRLRIEIILISRGCIRNKSNWKNLEFRLNTTSDRNYGYVYETSTRHLLYG